MARNCRAPGKACVRVEDAGWVADHRGFMAAIEGEDQRRIYDEIVSRVRDPALLEFAGHDLLRTSVFPGHA